MNRTDINKVAETILIPLLAEVYGYTNLKNLNYTEDSNYPGIDLGDETARVAFQVTSTSDSDKVKHTLIQFVENKFYENYDKLIIYILKKKQKSYAGSGYEEIIQDKFTFDKDKDILDYCDILKEVANFQIDKARRVESILEANFGEGRTLSEWEVVDNVERIVNEYTQLFVGREEESQKLDKFLSENSSGVMLVTAGAGFGKTALLANWVNAWRDKDCFTAYHFFTQRYCSVKSAYRNLLRQLYIYYKPTYEQIPNDEEELKIRVYNLFRDYAAREGEPLIIVIDGLDEAENTFSPPFPNPLPENVFVIASARAEKGEEHKYLEYWTDNSQQLNLNRLSCGAIAQWLRNTDELAAFAEDTHFVAQLDEITQGFPLYLSYLTDELSRAAKREEDVREVLAQTPKGFERYVEQQLRRLEELDLPDERWQFFALLAVAKGVLEKEDVKALTGMRDRSLRQLNQSWQVTRWMRITEGKLYAFAHPLLAKTFAAQLEDDDDAKDALKNLIDYCAQWEKHQSRYALRHYAEHLREVEKWEELYAIARNENFAATQREHLPDEPDLPLKTVQIALHGAADTDNAGVMAEFLLVHVRRLVQTTIQESPLDALRSSSLERALALADLYEIERCTLWYLLLAWVLKDQDRLEEARATLERLLTKELPHWSGSLSEYEAHLIMNAIDISENAYTALSRHLADDDVRSTLCKHLAAHGYFTKALEITHQIDNRAERAWALALVAEGMAMAGDVASALEIVEQIDYGWEQAWALGAIAKAKAQTGEFPKALEIVIQIGYKAPLAWALGAIAEAEFKTGNTEVAQFDFNAALSIAVQIEDKLTQVGVLGSLANARTIAGHWKAAQSTFAIALETARQIDNFLEKPRALRKIAQAQAQARDFDSALETVQQIDDERERSEALKEVAEAYALAGDFDTAIKIAWQIDSASQQAQAIGLIALAQSDTGDRKAAKSTFTTALQIAQQIEALETIALAQVEAGDREAAQFTFATLLKAAPQFDWERNRAEALKAIAKVQDQTEDFATAQEKARRLDNKVEQKEALTANTPTQTQVEDISTALEMALLIDDERERSRKLAEIALAQDQKGDREAAQSTLALAIEAAKQLSDIHDQQAMELWGIVRVQAKVRDFANALETAQQINVGYRRVDALKTIVEAQAEAREFAAALELVRQINDEWKRSVTIAMIAKEQVKAGHGQQALKTTQTILTERQWHLPGVAAAFVKTGDKASFKGLLIPCAYYLNAAYRMCEHLAWMYPEKAEEIAKVVSEFC